MNDIELTKAILRDITSTYVDTNGTLVITSKSQPHHTVLFGVDDTDKINVTLIRDGNDTEITVVTK